MAVLKTFIVLILISGMFIDSLEYHFIIVLVTVCYINFLRYNAE